LGEDLTNTAPRLALSLRQAVRQQSLEMADKLKIPRWQDAAVREAAQQQKNLLFIATAAATRLDNLATHTYRGAPEDLARLGFAIAHQLDSKAPAVPDLTEAQQALVDSIAKSLKQAHRPLIISGTSSQSQAMLQAAANIASALSSNQHRPADLYFTLPECNSLGLHFMEGGSLSTAFKAMAEGMAETVVILENDLYQRAEQTTVDTFLQQAKHVVVLDHLRHDTAVKAEIALPASTFAEADGTLVSSEGRAQRFFQVFRPEGDIQESWRWLRDAMVTSGQLDPQAWQSLDDLTHACARTLPIFRRILEAAPPATFRMTGMRIPREPPRYSGRTAMTAHLSVHEPKPPADPDSPLSFSMEGYPRQPPAPIIPYVWAPAWNSVQAVNKFQEEIGGILRGGPTGIRLIEPSQGTQAFYFDQIPPAFERCEDQWLILPLYHIFGSEELSVLAPAIAERIPPPYLALNLEDAAKLEVESGDGIELTLAGKSYHLPACYHNALPRGIAGIPFGLPALKGTAPLPAWGQISRKAP
jgi:NADH-quinone oxidoreductase subunit G